MFPEVDDYIEVVSKGHPHDGLIGKVVSTAPSKVVAIIYGREVTLQEKQVIVKAKLGTRAHSLMSRRASNWDLDSLDRIGLYVLMDVALWLRDYEWCKDIHERMQKVG